MGRLFSRRQRKALRIIAGNRCRECNAPLSNSFHADHKYPFSKGGLTIINNGQALCPKCNLKKGVKMSSASQPNHNEIKLRRWQTAAKQQCLNWYQSGSDTDHKIFLANAAPGAGKTLFASVVAASLFELKLIDRVVIIAPREEIVSQWSLEYNRVTGREMTKVTGSDCDIDGFGLDLCVTWNSVENLKEGFQKVCDQFKTFLICDEHHHAAKHAAWGKGADNAFRNAEKILILTGTPVRSDGNETVWLHY